MQFFSADAMRVQLRDERGCPPYVALYGKQFITSESAKRVRMGNKRAHSDTDILK